MDVLPNAHESIDNRYQQLRHTIRAGLIDGTTAGLAPGAIQGNIVILPKPDAEDFVAFCHANSQACPLLAVSDPGDPALPTLGADIDMRHDLPRYRVFRDGVLAEEVTDIAHLWRDDLVTCVIGCSFTFEAALIAAGIPLRHVSLGRNVAMYRTTRPLAPVGRFGGTLVVSMRPVAAENVARAAAITARYPDTHGAPIASGTAADLGIADLGRPEYGDPVPIEPGEVPVFWACGVTSQVAAEQALLPFFIAHAPGCMLITDRRHPEAG
jgi:uncharacterized protein YcsI (UPF0317 family)